MRKLFEIGGLAAAAVLIAFGIGALVMSINARNTVTDEVTAEQIVGSADMNPTDIKVAMTEAGLKNVSARPATSPISPSRTERMPAASRSTCAFTHSSRRVG